MDFQYMLDTVSVSNEPIKEFYVYTDDNDVEPFHFKGYYVGELGRTNWHYYIDIENQTILHFRKEHIVCVTEQPIK